MGRQDRADAMKIRCPSCESEWPANMKFCGTCGTKLVQADRGELAAGETEIGELQGAVREEQTYSVYPAPETDVQGPGPDVIEEGAPQHKPPKVGRNDPCPCGSGKKYKACHGRG